MAQLNWNGRNYRPVGNYIKVVKPDINELMKPLSLKSGLGSAILTGQAINPRNIPTSPVVSPSVTPTLTVTPSITPTSTLTPTPSITPTSSPLPADCVWNTTDELWNTNTNLWNDCQNVPPSPSVTPTSTLTPTPSVTPTLTPTITPTITPSITPSSTPSSLVNYTFTYVGAQDASTDSRPKTVSNLNFTFMGNTFTRTGLTYTTYPTTSSEALTPTGVTGTGAFVVSRNICRGTLSGGGEPRINRIALQIKVNSVVVYNNVVSQGGIIIPRCDNPPTKLDTLTSTNITVSSGDNVEIIFTDVVCQIGTCF
jgi:hypothetical protein